MVAVVSRWFGGTKLGTGGLVRAFSGALKAALDVLPRTERVERKTFLLELPYPLYERVKLLVSAHHGEITAASSQGQGTIMTICLPRVPATTGQVRQTVLPISSLH